MFSGKTTLVVGAGAGYDYNMPLGSGLTKMIASSLTFEANDWGEVTSKNKALHEALRAYAIEEKLANLMPYFDACDEIINGMHEAQSIDEFIHTRRSDNRIELCGKAAIVYCILECERGSTGLHFHKQHIDDPATIDFAEIQSTWLPLFRKVVTGDCQADEIAERFAQITIINFNYDRCIEHYLLHSLMTYHKLDEASAAKAIRSLTIIHPYGVVGSLPWQGGTPSVAFGGVPNDIPMLANKIRTFTEQSEDDAMQEAIHSAIASSNLMLFLGFGYHKQNLDLLTMVDSSNTVNILGTATGISDTDTSLLQHNLAKRFCGRDAQAVRLSNKHDCKQLFSENWYRLSM